MLLHGSRDPTDTQIRSEPPLSALVFVAAIGSFCPAGPRIYVAIGAGSQERADFPKETQRLHVRDSHAPIFCASFLKAAGEAPARNKAEQRKIILLQDMGKTWALA